MLYTLSPVRLPGVVVLLIATLAAGCAFDATSTPDAKPAVGSDAQVFETNLS